MPIRDYVAAVGDELRVRFGSADRWELDTLYLGGGTPSRLGADGVVRLLDVILDRVTLARGAEVTLEANPEDVTRDAVARWRGAGVNRLSIGTQSFDDRVLAWMRRTHDAARAEAAIEAARDAGVDNLSLDLIFALPTSLGRSWDADLERAVSLAPSHVSLYGLTVEHATPLGRWVTRGEITESPEEQYEAEFLRAHAVMTAAGFDHYEVSNFARPGQRSRHNSAYWAGVPYAAVGPAAHEFDGESRRWNLAPYEQWRRTLERGEDPVAGMEVLTDENRRTETVYLGLRTSAGLRLSGGELPAVRPWIDAGWATVESGERLVLHPAGWLRLDALSRSLTAQRSR